MWPTLKDGEIVNAIQHSDAFVGDIVAVKHPFKKITLVKRIKKFVQDQILVEGDNPDPLGSEDSHNFGPLPTSSIIAVIQDTPPLLLRPDGET